MPASDSPGNSPSLTRRDGEEADDVTMGAVGDVIGRSVDDSARARRQLQESIEMIPAQEKAAYVEAIERVPHLVDLESNPDHHLEFAGGDPWKAAMRLASYWKWRVEIFNDRAYLPLSLTGEGAMSPEDIEVLKTGSLIILPEDNEGRSVLLHDRSRLTHRRVADGRRRVRCLFYLLSVLAESSKARRLGIVMVIPYGDKTPKNTFADPQDMHQGISLCRNEVLPVRIVKSHLIMMSNRPVLKIVVPMMLQILERLNYPIAPEDVVVHQFRPLEKQRQALQEYGFDLEGIPKVPFGGLLSLGVFKRWIEDRHRYDAHVYGDVAVQRPNAMDDLSFAREAEESKRKDAEAAYARKKRLRKRIEHEVMQEEVDRLKRQSQRLKNKGHELERLLLEATRMVQLHATPTSQLPALTTNKSLTEFASLPLREDRVIPLSTTPMPESSHLLEMLLRDAATTSTHQAPQNPLHALSLCGHQMQDARRVQELIGGLGGVPVSDSLLQQLAIMSSTNASTQGTATGNFHHDRSSLSLPLSVTGGTLHQQPISSRPVTSLFASAAGTRPGVLPGDPNLAAIALLNNASRPSVVGRDYRLYEAAASTIQDSFWAQHPQPTRQVLLEQNPADERQLNLLRMLNEYFSFR